MTMMAADHITAIKHFEAKGGQPHLSAYQCGAREWTIGFGRKRGVGPNDTCTPHEAEMMLQEDIADANAAIKRLFRGMYFTSGERAALVSFLINFGETKFRGYSLYDLIKNNAPQPEIFEQWVKYQYTIRDEDADGDLDAVIDRGLPIRRYREILLWSGHSWAVAQAAANENNLDLREERVGWKDDGFRERLISRTPVAEVLRRAETIARFEREEEDQLQPDAPAYAHEPFLFDEPEDRRLISASDNEEKINMAYETVEDSADVALATKERHPDAAREASKPLQSDNLNAQQVSRLQNPKTASTMRQSITRKTQVPPPAAAPMEDPTAKVVPVESVGYLAGADKVPGNITAKRVDKAQRGKGFAKQAGGKELIGIGAAGMAAEYVGATEPILKVVDKYPRETLAWVIGGILVFGFFWYAIGSWQRERGEDKAEDLMR